MPFSFSKTVDTIIALRIVKILVQKWEETDAYKLGIIDKEGNFLKKTRELKTTAEKAAFTKFHVIIFRLKKVLEKIPFGKTRLGSLALALMLLKEETDTKGKKLVEFVVWNHIKETMNSAVLLNTLCEEAHINERITIGSHTLKEEAILNSGDIANVGDVVIVESSLPVATIFGTPIFEAQTENGEHLYITKGNI